jgi:hypothetical protein
MNEQERIAAMAYDLSPMQAAAFIRMRDHDGEFVPFDLVHSDYTYRKVMVTKLRQKLRPFDIGVLNVFGKGYKLVPVSDCDKAKEKKEERRNEILRLYAENEKLDYIAAIFEISHTTVSKMAKAAGLPQRQPRC